MAVDREKSADWARAEPQASVVSPPPASANGLAANFAAANSDQELAVAAEVSGSLAGPTGGGRLGAAHVGNAASVAGTVRGSSRAQVSGPASVVASSPRTAAVLPGRWTLVWPGLPRLWLDGQWRGLATAFVFSVMLNAALLATFDALGGSGRLEMAALWAAVGLFWFVSARNSHRWRVGLARLPKREECDRRFAAAQDAYLKGHWPEAESLLRQLLEARPEDLEGRLLLATLLRRMDRAADARSQLEEFARRSGSERWSLEFRREWEAVQRQRAGGEG